MHFSGFSRRRLGNPPSAQSPEPRGERRVWRPSKGLSSQPASQGARTTKLCVTAEVCDDICRWRGETGFLFQVGFPMIPRADRRLIGRLGLGGEAGLGMPRIRW